MNAKTRKIVRWWKDLKIHYKLFIVLGGVAVVISIIAAAASAG